MATKYIVAITSNSGYTEVEGKRYELPYVIEIECDKKPMIDETQHGDLDFGEVRFMLGKEVFVVRVPTVDIRSEVETFTKET